MATGAFGWARSVASCNLPRTATYSGLAGQSPLPKKDPHDLEAARWRLRLMVAGKSAASCQCLGHITRWGYWDSRRYRRRAARFGGGTMATASFGRGKSVASCQYLGHITRRAYWDPTSSDSNTPAAWWFIGLCRTGSRRYQKKIRTIWRQHDGDCGFRLEQVSGFVPILGTHHTMGVVGKSPLPEKAPHDFEDTGRKRA